MCVRLIYATYHYHHTGAIYSASIRATDADGFYNTITYSIDNDYNGVFTINNVTGEFGRTSNESIPAPAAVSNSISSHF